MMGWVGRPPDKPDTVFDEGLQHERTTLAWERTAISMVVAGTIVARWGVGDGLPVHAGAGVIALLIGVSILVWSGHNYSALHGPLHAGASPVQPRLTRLVGTVTTLVTLSALTLGIILVLRRELGWPAP